MIHSHRREEAWQNDDPWLTFLELRIEIDEPEQD